MSIHILPGVELPPDVAETLRDFSCYRCGQKHLKIHDAAISARGVARERWAVDTECLWCGLNGRYFTIKMQRPDETAWLPYAS